MLEGVGTIGNMENIYWFEFYMSGGIGFSNASAAGFTGNVMDGFSEELLS